LIYLLIRPEILASQARLFCLLITVIPANHAFSHTIAKSIDENNKWGFGSNHLAITGNVLGRGDKVTEILFLKSDKKCRVSLHGMRDAL
jgi:hypothetical protein